jgi:hypothetical protein
MEDAAQVEYLEEIADLRRRARVLEEAQGSAELIAEYLVEIQILESLLLAARELRDQLVQDPELGETLLLRGFSPASFQDVYSFVYESSMEIELSGERLARAVSETDFSILLRRRDPVSGSGQTGKAQPGGHRHQQPGRQEREVQTGHLGQHASRRGAHRVDAKANEPEGAGHPAEKGIRGLALAIRNHRHGPQGIQEAD